MPARSAARRYSQAVFQIATEQDTLEVWEQDLGAIASAFAEPDLARVLESPRLRLAQKMDMVRGLLAGISPLALNLAQLLVIKGRMGLAADIAEEYRRLLDASRGIETADVTTAVPLGDAEIARIGQRLGQLRGREVRVRPQVAPAIVGGIVARIGDRLIDGSVKVRLASLKRRLAEGT